MASLFDGLVNVAAQMGIGKAKTAGDAFVFYDRANAELTSMYRGDWLARKIVDLPALDMLREWRMWVTDAKTATAIEDGEERHRLRAKLVLAVKLARLYGGSGIIIGADVGNPSLPLDVRRVGRGGLKYLTVCSREDLKVLDLDRNPASPNFGQPTAYMLASQSMGSVTIHPSRVLRFLGNERLDMRFSADGWGDSVLASIYDAIHHAALTQAGIAELVHEAKVDVITVPNLSAMASSAEGERKLVQRFTVANTLKSINNMLLLDEGEKWDRKQTSFASLPDVLDRYLQIVAGAADIPATRLLGIAPKGLNATGESDVRNYYDMLAATRQMQIGANLAVLDDLIIRDALGSVPADIYAEWKPLWQSTETEQAAIAKTKAETSQIYAMLNVMPEEALRQGIQNQLIEAGTYPGLEAAIEQLRLSIAGQEAAPPAENDNSAANRAVSSDRTRLLGRAQGYR